MAFSLAAKIHCCQYWLRKASLCCTASHLSKSAAAGSQGAQEAQPPRRRRNLLLSARTSTITLSAPPKALLVSYVTVGRDRRDDGLDGGCSLSSSRNRFLLRSEKRRDPLKSCPILQHIARRPACVKQRCTLVTGQLTRARRYYIAAWLRCRQQLQLRRCLGISPPCRLQRRPPARARWPDAVLRTAGSSRLARGAEAEWL